MTSKRGTFLEPNLELWNNIYKNKKDNWSNEEADGVVTEFSMDLTQRKVNQSILVPLCGRSKVVLTLAEQGHKVVGIEWSKIAILAFFEDNKLPYVELVYSLDGKDIPMYQAKEKLITIYCADIFAFKNHKGIGLFDCILDHGSIGMFYADRAMYAAIIKSFIKPGGRVLLSIFDYVHSEHPTIPFAVTEEEVISTFKDTFKTITLAKELDAKAMAKVFHLESPDCYFPVLTLSRLFWKIILMN